MSSDTDEAVEEFFEIWDESTGKEKEGIIFELLRHLGGNSCVECDEPIGKADPSGNSRFAIHHCRECGAKKKLLDVADQLIEGDGDSGV